MKERIAILLPFFIIVTIIMFTLHQKMDMPLQMIDRASGLFAYLFLFLAILSSEYMRQMKKIFGKGFIAIHHHIARIGVTLMLIHPIAFALEESSFLVFIPVLLPIKDFLELAGRPALYLILIATLAGMYRKKIIKKWKKIHYLNYIAFPLLFVHSWLIGTDLQSGIMQLLWFTMFFLVIAIFIHKHIIKSDLIQKFAV